MTVLLIHVRCDERGTWFVHVGDSPTPVSAHSNETHAERAADALAGGIDSPTEVVVHDRYARTHPGAGA